MTQAPPTFNADEDKVEAFRSYRNGEMDEEEAEEIFEEEYNRAKNLKELDEVVTHHSEEEDDIDTESLLL